MPPTNNRDVYVIPQNFVDTGTVLGGTVKLRNALEAGKEYTEGCPTVFEITREERYRRHWKTFATYNNISAITPYELRHTFVSVVKTLPAGEVKELVGHSMNMDTFGTYAHYLDGDDERTAQSVNTVFLRVLNA